MQRFKERIPGFSRKMKRTVGWLFLLAFTVGTWTIILSLIWR